VFHWRKGKKKGALVCCYERRGISDVRVAREGEDGRLKGGTATEERRVGAKVCFFGVKGGKQGGRKKVVLGKELSLKMSQVLKKKRESKKGGRDRNPSMR